MRTRSSTPIAGSKIPCGEVAELRERNHELESQMSKVARIGKREEMDFADEVQTWPGMCVSQKLAGNGDYLLAFRDPSGAPLEPRLLVDNKDKAAITEGDIRKLIRDAKERHVPVGVILAKDETSYGKLPANGAGQRKTGFGCSEPPASGSLQLFSPQPDITYDGQSWRE